MITKAIKAIDSNLKTTFSIEYRNYIHMLKACYDTEYSDYMNYGAGGTSVCRRWLKGENDKNGFECFIEDMGPPPFNQYTIEIINIKKSFVKDNTKWASKFVSMSTLSPIEKIYNKTDVNLKDMCLHYGIALKRGKKFISRKNQPLDLRWLRYKILALDPGTKNFAYTWIKKGKVYASGLLGSTIHDITAKQLTKSVSAFLSELTNILDKTKPDLVIIERFMLRLFGTKLIELVGIMLGMVANICHSRGIEIILLTSSQWKLSAKKHIDLKQLYKEGKSKFKLPPHPIDAMCMARYLMSCNNYTQRDLIWLKRNLPNCTKNLS